MDFVRAHPNTTQDGIRAHDPPIDLEWTGTQQDAPRIRLTRSAEYASEPGWGDSGWSSVGKFDFRSKPLGGQVANALELGLLVIPFASRVSGEHGAKGPLVAAAATTALATLLSYGLPEEHAATGVGATFLVAVYLLVLRSGDNRSIALHGLALGGLFDQEPLSLSRLLRSALGALGWAVMLALIVFPPFWFSYLLWYEPQIGFSPAPLPSLGNDVFGQLLGIAFPEEAFYRGYLQSALDRAWPPRRRFLSAPLGPGVVVSSALFALGHYLTEPSPARLAVFFPSLLFGWLRARTGGVGAPIAFHALCNLFATFLGRSYRLFA